MIGIVLVTHGNLAREFLAALEHVVGPQQCISAVCIGAEDDMEKRRSEILERARACDTGDGVIVLTDMFSGTPSNLAISIMDQARIEVLAGGIGSSIELACSGRQATEAMAALSTLVEGKFGEE